MSPGDWLAIIGLFISVVAFVSGLYQYRQAQRWKAIEFISVEVKEFFGNNDVLNAMKMLDYNGSPINFSVIRDGQTQIERIHIDDEAVIAAFTPHFLKPGTTYKDELIRGAFEVFLDYLARFEHYIAGSGLLKYEDFHPYLNYWLSLMSPYKNTRKSRVYIERLYAFLDAYDYNSVRKLIKRNENFRQKHQISQKASG